MNKKSVTYLVAVVFISLCAALYVTTKPAKSYSSGITDYSGDPAFNGGQTCSSGCHGTGQEPVVTLNGTTLVMPGETAVYTLTVQSAVPLIQTHAGLNVSVTGGTLAALDADTQIMSDQIAHTSPKVNDGAGTAVYTFGWTAPATADEYILYGAGNSVDRNFLPSGDASDADSLAITVIDPLLTYEPVVSGFNRPVAIANAGDGRLFIVEKAGIIRIVENGTVLPTPFLDITTRVDSSSNEEGLLGLAFHPDYVNNGRFYVNYVNTTGSRRTRVSEFTVSADPDIADANSEDILLTVTQPSSNHNGGDLAFGPDGYLYIPLGDGGGAGDTANNSQNTALLLGKLSRIDVDSGAGSSPDCDGIGSGNYTIPSDNPFIDGAGSVCDEIWAMGLRNPWRVDFDAATGDLWIGDVGQYAWEEIDFQPASSTGGENYGWRCYEGDHAFNTSGCGSIDSYEFPKFEYSHADGNCSVTGGKVYRGQNIQLAALDGHYLLADYCSGDLWAINSSNFSATPFTNSAPFGITTFGVDADGELYFALDGTSASLYKITDVGQPDTPIAGLSATNSSPTLLSDTTTFTATITAGTSVAYSWDFGDGNAATGITASHVYTATGTYTATVTAVNDSSQMVTNTVVTILPNIPIADLSATNSSPTLLSDTTTFTATITAGTNIVYTWDFGDGNAATGITASHVYTATGTYTATVTAVNDSSQMMVNTVVTVLPVPSDHYIYLPMITKD